MTTPSSPPTPHTLMEQRSFLLMLALVSLLFLYLLKPFFSAIFWACVLAILFAPLQRQLLARWKKPNLAALATLGLCVLLVVLPVVLLLGSLVQEGAQLYQRVQSGDMNPAYYIDQIRHGFPAVQALLERFEIDLAGLKEQLSGAAVTVSRWLAHNALAIGQNMMQFFISLALMLYLAFFLLRDGTALVRLLIRALPLGDAREELLFGKFAEVTRATIKGNLVVAIIQGGLGGIMFWIMDIPGAVLWGTVMIVLSLIPVVGASLIWGPVAIYLFATGHWIQGLILTAFGAGVIGLIDNLLRPILVGRDTKLPDFMVLLSTLGGFALFGMNGFVIGPLVAVLFIAFWQIFMLEFNPQPEPADND